VGTKDEGQGTRRISLNKIISGGQTGVDRAAIYPLGETETESYEERTRLNVLESDATLILTLGPLAGGTLLTNDLAQGLGRPSRVVDLSETPAPADAARWITGEKIATLNVAGPRESTQPGIYESAREFLEAVLRAVTGRS
jgi:hypothetical protein